MPWLADRTLLAARVPLTKPPTVLLDRADEIRRTLGYADTPADRAFGLYHNTDYLQWGRGHGSGEAGWRELATGRPAGLMFWYRTSPVPMIPFDKMSVPDPTDPPLTTAGMTSLTIDTNGRLQMFTAVPPQIEPAPLSPAATDWPALFAAAGLDMATFADAAPARTPPAFADDRRAWKGVLPEQRIPVTIEAAGYRGRPVFFEVVAPWTVASREPGAPDTSSSSSAGSTAFVLVLLVAAIVFARKNLRSGRADRRGALRLGTALFLVYAATWLLVPHVSRLDAEANRLFTFVGIGLFVGGVMCLVYLALEPFVRRSWPTMLVGWSRALAGRLRDPVVGRDLLIGTASGLALTALEHANVIVPRLVGWPEPAPLTSNLGALEHTRYFVLTITNSLNNGLQNALLSVMMFTLVREIIKRVLGRLAPSRWSTDAISAGIAITALTLIRLAESPVGPPRLWLVGAYEILSAAVFLFVLARYGLLATVVMYTINALTMRMPLTLRHESLYAGPAWVTLGLVLAVAALGLWLARAGEPLFGGQTRRV